MSSIVEGDLCIVTYGSKSFLKGFTRKDMRVLGVLARKRYKLKTSSKRIVKKYIKQLINDALRNYVSSA
jgi:hypothetical protein